MDDVSMTRSEMVTVFNEWMRQWIENPSEFESLEEVAEDFNGSNYGESAADSMFEIMDELIEHGAL